MEAKEPRDCMATARIPISEVSFVRCKGRMAS